VVRFEVLHFIILYIGFIVVPLVGGIGGLIECYFEFKKRKIVEGCLTLALSIFLLTFQVVFFYLFLLEKLIALL
jgi:hypothetical protein